MHCYSHLRFVAQVDSKPQPYLDAAGHQSTKVIKVWAPAPTVVNTPFDPGRDLVELSAKKDYSLGMIDYCPVHGINVTELHTDGRCNSHKREVRNIAIRKQRQRRDVENKNAQRAFVRAHGVQGKAQGLSHQ